MTNLQIKKNSIFSLFSCFDNVILLSKVNIGMVRALNKASKLSNYDYILISHDDFYYCPG